MIEWLLYLTLIAFLLSGLGLNLIGLPGLWLMVAAHGTYAALTPAAVVGWPSVIAIVSLALLAEVIEFVAGAAGSKAAGGALRSTIGAVVGGVAGGILGVVLVPFLPIVNAILGACVGSFLGAAALEASKAPATVERRIDFYKRLDRVGRGAFWGKLWGILLKTVVGVVMLVVSLWTAWA